MYEINVPVIVDGKENVSRETIYTVNDFPWEKFNIIRTVKTRGKKKAPTYYNIPCAFDIETTTLQKVDCDHYNKTDEIRIRGESYMYQWQFCLRDFVVFGRTWEEFLTFCNTMHLYLKTDDKTRLVVYVHNLSYEFQFMKEFLELSEIFAKDAHKVIKCFCHRYGIEFRCSYFLSNMSLAKFCENSKGVTHYKLVDSYNYRKLRTPRTPLTEDEQGYCYNDVRGLCECIRDRMFDDNLSEIPLTSTGYVRREFRKAMQADESYYPYQFSELRLTLPQYQLCKAIFRGGNTHANRIHAGHTITKLIGSMDISSSYPAQIAIAYYPMTAFRKVEITAQDQFDRLCNRCCVLMRAQFSNLRLKENVSIPYVDFAHCEKYGKDRILDNGRVLSIDFCELPLTEIDLGIIKNQYNYDYYTVSECYVAERGKLPTSMRNTMMDFFIAKSQLKGNPEKIYEYMKAKNKLNSTFGMCVTDLLQETWSMNHVTGEWTCTAPDAQKALDDYYNSQNAFLHYQWGIYVTAHARKQLQDMLDVVGMDVVYCDTDSIKFLHPEKYIPLFTAKNAELEKRALENDVPAYCVVNGKRYVLGLWDMDDTYIQFKVLGAKKYCGIEWDEKAAKAGKEPCRFVTTVAGMNKKLGAENIKCPNNFRLKRKMEDIGRTTSWFNEGKPHYITVNGDTFCTASNIGILDTTYTLGVTDEYYSILQASQNGIKPE